MNFYKNILERTSVRDFDESKEISPEIMNQLINTIQLAPTSSNWFSSSAIVISDKKLLQKLSQTSKYMNHLSKAKMLVVFLADYNRMELAKKTYPEYKYKSNSSESFTVGIGDAFIQATMLQDIAIANGLGTCFLGLVRTIVDELIDILNIKGKAYPVIGLAVGYAKTTAPVKPKLNRVFMNEYNFEAIECQANKYSEELIEYYSKLNPNKPSYSYLEASIISASRYVMDTDKIENIWDLQLVEKNK
ncbi:nitroreductase family protein [Mycoplasma phocoenae]|uniref:Nitroreductase n=1 Tax=Mycoplasma phocoenae TaxID=754517 RepID=A0A858U6Q1_9MOLU|nr:nitroreductase family protein [Mycoplasma phocoenae]QJG66945.1 nitroreductase [Mycoplasma phocoenae]